MGIAICVTLLSEIHFPNSSKESKPGSGWHTGHHRSSITDLRSLPDVYYNSSTKNIAMDRDPRSHAWIQFTLSGEGILAPYSAPTASPQTVWLLFLPMLSHVFFNGSQGQGLSIDLRTVPSHRIRTSKQRLPIS